MLVSGVLLFELVLVAIFAGLLGRSEQDLEDSYQTVSVISHIDKVKSLLVDMELTATQPQSGRSFDSEMQQLTYEFKALRLLLREDPFMVNAVDGFETQTTILSKHLKTSNPGGGFDHRQFEDFRGSLLASLDRMLLRYKRPTEFIMDRATIQRRMTESNVLVVILVNAVLAVGTVLYFMQGIVNRLSVVADNSVRFGRGEDLNPPLEGADEIASLDQILHETIRQRTLIETLLKESEAHTRSLIENMPVGVVAIDEYGIIESINPRTEKIFGYTFDELLGDHLMALFMMPADVSRNQFTTMIQQKVLGKTANFESRRKNGEVFPIEMSLTEFDSMDGRRYLAIIQDITERAKAEQFKQELIAMVSHDLRSPLTSVQGVVTLLARGMYGQLTEIGEKRVRAADQSISRLIHLVDDMLDLERMEAGKLQFNQQSVPISSVIDRSIELVYDFAQQSQLKFEFVSNDIDVYVDEDRIVQVIVNLLSNAIKFSPAGKTITICTEVVENDQIEVRVSDEGPGIATEYLDTIFDRFNQIEGVPTQHKGTGLGLAICKAIVEGHDGTIGAASEPGNGSTFWFRVPAKAPGGLITLAANESKQGTVAVP
jgi:PAS domain S-box-containing protein